MTGVEYETDASSPDPNHFVIRKQHREMPTVARPIAMYYVNGKPGDTARGTVYALPTIDKVFKYNMASAMFYVDDAMQKLSKEVEFDVHQGHVVDGMSCCIHEQPRLAPVVCLLQLLSQPLMYSFTHPLIHSVSLSLPVCLSLCLCVFSVPASHSPTMRSPHWTKRCPRKLTLCTSVRTSSKTPQ
jgi:MED6 mediator sub complex component